MDWASKSFVVIVLLVLVDLGSPSGAAADLVTFGFSAEIQNVTDWNNLLGGAINVGDPFFGEFAFDSTTADSNPDDPTHGIYDGAIVSISGQAGSLLFGGPVNGENSIEIGDRLSDDFYTVRAGVDLGQHVAIFSLGGEGDGLSNDSLPLSAADLASIDLSVAISPADGAFAFHARLASIVPEPGTLSLLVAGALASLRARRTTRRWMARILGIGASTALGAGPQIRAQ